MMGPHNVKGCVRRENYDKPSNISVAPMIPWHPWQAADLEWFQRTSGPLRQKSPKSPCEIGAKSAHFGGACGEVRIWMSKFICFELGEDVARF